jgi:hypothetical protein
VHEHDLMSTSRQLPANSDKIAAFKSRIKTLGRLPFKIKDLPPTPTESYLCDFCAKLDLKVESFVVQPGDNEHERENRFRWLGKLSYIQQRLHCPLCRLVLSIADRPLDQRNPSHIADEDPAVYARWVVDGQDEEQHPSRSGSTAFRPRTRRILIYSDPQTFKDGYLVLLADDAPSRPYYGRMLTTQGQLDAGMLKQWLKNCETLHGPECEVSLVPAALLAKRIGVFRAIDVDQMCIVEPPKDARFIALSYLWGKNFAQLFTTSENLAKLSTPGALTKEKLPRTIKDTIQLTRMLGEKYLWTDSLCLIHDPGFQYHDDWVYARASLTVAAGSGKDANAGLPGVRKESRAFHQDIEEVVPGLRLMVAHIAEDYINTSQWDSRAWVFGERMLSRRCLLFVNGRIYFQCRRATFCEDIETPATNGWSLNCIDMPTRIFRERLFWQFSSAVELYTQRDLTNPQDILDAFEAVGTVLEARLNMKLFFGMPDNMIDTALIWESSKMLKRRQNFSTMSWAGWVGEIQWKVTEMADSWIEWHTIDQTGDVTPFPVQARRRIRPPVPKSIDPIPAGYSICCGPTMPRLHFQTLSASFTLLRPTTITKDIVSPLRKRMTGPAALSTKRPAPTDPGLIRAGIADKNGEWCGTIDLTMTYRELVSVPVEFLVMSRTNRFTEAEIEAYEGWLPDAVEEEMRRRDYGAYNVLLVTFRDGVYYREALGRILASAVHRALAPGPVWKDIVLG